MVVLFSERKSKTENEISNILLKHNAKYISDNKIIAGKDSVSVICQHKNVRLETNEGIAVFTDDTNRFENQILPNGIIGICESGNLNALKVFKKNEIPVITCGMNSKSTVTFSSFCDGTALLSLQRTVNGIEPQEIKIKLCENYQPFSVMVGAMILLLCGINPNEF